MALAQKSESVKVKMDVREKAMSAPAVIKKVQTNSPLAKVSLPEMPDVPTDNVMPSLMPGMANTFGAAPGAGGGGGGSGGGMQNSTFFGTPGGKVGLIGTFYDTKQNRGRQEITNNFDIYKAAVKKFVDGGFKGNGLSEFFRVPNAVASSMIFIPQIDAEEGPSAFRVSNRVKPRMWLVHYEATVVPPVSGTYHFVGAGDDVMLVAIDNKIVLDRGWNLKIADMEENYEYGYSGIPNGFARGPGFTVEAGKEYKFDAMIGEMPGGKLFAFVFIAKDGETPLQSPERNLPVFPVFRVANVKLPAVQDGTNLPPFDQNVPPWSVWKAVPPKKGGSIDTSGFFRGH
jgi:hypothetical protein